ncbi:hypothetical protein [Xanthomonas cassavae]|uniref:hypothetical protein n=1 Tax=Xanthomonas cassavae TaxID=56450 RepID=UPI0004194FBB
MIRCSKRTTFASAESFLPSAATPLTSASTPSRFSGRLAHRLMFGTAVIASLCFGLTAAITY